MFKIKVILCAALMFQVFHVSQSQAWSLHYLMTDRSLEHPSMAFTDKKVAVEPFEAFLTDQKMGLKKLFEEYYDWLASTGSKRFIKKQFDAKNPTVLSFLRAARLNQSG